jgi:hypothetical protein
MRKSSPASIVFLVAVGLVGCSRNPVISSRDVEGWPLTVNEVEIICKAGKPVRAVILGSEYALNGREAAESMAKGVDLPFLNHEQPSLFKPNPDPLLAALGEKALLGDFNLAAERACKG